MTQTEKPLKSINFCFVRLEFFFEARCAEDPIRMLRNALPTKKVAALGTSGHCFAELMVGTTLVGQVWHG